MQLAVLRIQNNAKRGNCSFQTFEDGNETGTYHISIEAAHEKRNKDTDNFLSRYGEPVKHPNLPD
jgi:hypothetical protein